MDSRQLISALHEAQNKAGGRPCIIKIISRRAKDRSDPKGITVSYDPAPRGAEVDQVLKPTITITHVQ